VSFAEWQTRVNLAAAYRLVALYGWDLPRPTDPHCVHTPNSSVSKHRRRTPGNPKVRQALHQRGKPFLQLRPRKDLAETSMRTGAKDQMPARMIGPPDVEAVRVGIERRISHGGQGRERQDAIARNDVVANLDVLASEPGNRSDRRRITQRFGTGTWNECGILANGVPLLERA
jgi:hypothetical protein